MRRVLATDAAELLQLQPLRHRLPVLGRRIVALLAFTALQRNDFSGHKNRSWLENSLSLKKCFQLKTLSS
jgi:hypothetical protein